MIKDKQWEIQQIMKKILAEIKHKPKENYRPYSVLSLKRVNKNMHKKMGAKFVQDADADYVLGMIPHHQGAIDMAKILLKHSKDLRIRALANNIIGAQVLEIETLKRWYSRFASHL